MKTRAIMRHDEKTGVGVASAGVQLNHLINMAFHACLQRLLKQESGVWACVEGRDEGGSTPTPPRPISFATADCSRVLNV
jgi:hypothetical protein